MIFKNNDFGILRRLGFKIHYVKVKQWPYVLEVRYVLQGNELPRTSQ